MDFGRTSPLVSGLAYIVVNAVDPQEWTHFATQVLGMQESPILAGIDDNVDAAWLKMDERAWRIAVRSSDTNDLDCLGWEVSDAEAFERVVSVLQASGIVTKVLGHRESIARGVQGIVRFTDPAGISAEICYGHLADFDFTSPFGVEFVTGAGGMGHMAWLVDRYEEAADFYTRVLGLSVSDYHWSDGSRGVFLRAGPREHSLALIESEQTYPLHLMMETTRLERVGQALDRATESTYGLARTLGQHSNDRMVSFYAKTPANFEIEYGWNGFVIEDDETWVARRLHRGSLWGHRFL